MTAEAASPENAGAASLTGPAADVTSLVELRGVAMTYPGTPPVPALRPTDLTVQNGEYIAVVGPSGSGKSTLLHILGLIDRPSAGSYRLAGTDTGALREAELTALRAYRIGFVFQAFHLINHRSAEDNVGLGLLYQGVPARTRVAAAREALQRVGLAHRMAATPSRLSGGERQRVAIARALVSRPTLLLCDEPTGNLDSVTGATVLNLVDDLHHDGQTVIVVTHDPLVAQRASRTVSMVDGALAMDIPAGARR